MTADAPAGAAATPVEARDLVKRYGSVVACDHVDLTVRAGDIYGFLGPNGAGKTTALRMILGLIRPDEGTVRLFGCSPQTNQPRCFPGKKFRSVQCFRSDFTSGIESNLLLSASKMIVEMS